MTLDIQVNLAESVKVSFFNQKERHIYSEYGVDKNCTSSEDNHDDWEESSGEEDESSYSNTEEISTADSCRIVFLLVFTLFLRSSTASFRL